MRVWDRNSPRGHGGGAAPPDDLAVALAEIRRSVEAVEGDAALLVEPNFGPRTDALDQLEVAVLNRIDALPFPADPALLALGSRAQGLVRRLEGVNSRHFRHLRSEIRTGALRGTAFARVLSAHAGPSRSGAGYDLLDAFVAGLLLPVAPPPPELPCDPEMVPYQPTPVRVVLDLVARAGLTPDDVFYDIGSGLGQVAILVHLLTGARARGVEVAPALCEYARAVAADLDLTGVTFIQADARGADYGDGTCFFLYAPFRGAMLAEVKESLQAEARQRPIRVFSYGPEWWREAFRA